MSFHLNPKGLLGRNQASHLLLCLQQSKGGRVPGLEAGRGASKWLLSPQTMARVGPENKSPSQAMSWLQLNCPETSSP